MVCQLCFCDSLRSSCWQLPATTTNLTNHQFPLISSIWLSVRDSQPGENRYRPNSKEVVASRNSRFTGGGIPAGQGEFQPAASLASRRLKREPLGRRDGEVAAE